MIIAGTNPVAADFVAVKLMGFDWQKLPTIREGLALFGLSPDDIEVVPELGETFQFKPHFGWKDHIEAR